MKNIPWLNKAVNISNSFQPTTRGHYCIYVILLEKTHKKMQEASNTIEDAVTKTRTIERKLNKVQNLPVAEAQKLVLEAQEEDVTQS